MVDILLYSIRKVALFIAWKFFAMLYIPFVLGSYIRYKRNPIKENQDTYIEKKNWWIRQITG